jgi:ABC-type lipoprotein export system ATPase subunit
MQRVTIARSLVTHPEIVLADEPTGNVSEKMGIEIMKLLKLCNEQFRQTILLVTHNHKDAACGSKVLFLKDGKIPEESILSGSEVNEAHIFSSLQKLNI